MAKDAWNISNKQNNLMNLRQDFKMVKEVLIEQQQ